MPEPNATPQEGNGAVTPQDGAGAAGGSTPEDQIPEYARELRREAAGWRTKYQGLRKEIDDLKAAQNVTPKPDAHGASGNGKDAPSGDAAAVQVSELRSLLQDAKKEIETIKKNDADRAAAAAKKLLRANLTKELAGKVLPDSVDEAITYLEARGARLTEDDRVVIDITDEGGESVPIIATAELLRKHKILTPHWFPPAGVGGSGSAAPRGAPAGVDLERAKTDLKYLKAHEKEVDEHLRAQGAR